MGGLFLWATKGGAVAYCLFCGRYCATTNGGACEQCAFDRRVRPGSNLTSLFTRGLPLNRGAYGTDEGACYETGGPSEEEGPEDSKRP